MSKFSGEIHRKNTSAKQLLYLLDVSQIHKTDNMHLSFKFKREMLVSKIVVKKKATVLIKERQVWISLLLNVSFLYQQESKNLGNANTHGDRQCVWIIMQWVWSSWSRLGIHCRASKLFILSYPWTYWNFQSTWKKNGPGKYQASLLQYLYLTLNYIILLFCKNVLKLLCVWIVLYLPIFINTMACICNFPVHLKKEDFNKVLTTAK